jgi:uroporphyrinogen decarboxylase
MNSYERVMTAMKRQRPDRVPLVEFVIDPKVYKALLPGAASQTDFEEHFDFDAVCCSASFEAVKRQADGSYLDEWGVWYKPTSEVVAHPVKGPIRTMGDLQKYAPPDPDVPHRLGRLPELVAKYKNRKAIIFHQRAALMWSAYLMGIDELLMNFLAEPELAHRLMDVVLENQIKIARRAVKAGADIIVLGDDYADNRGPMFSPAVFEEFILPRLKRMVGVIHNEGAKVVKHTDGNIWKILDGIVSAGIDGLNPIEPAAQMDIGAVKAKYGRRICLIGNIDCSHLLTGGTREEVEAAVKECIAKAGAGGGLIISSSNSIHSSVNPENYLAMIHAVRRWGAYGPS